VTPSLNQEQRRPNSTQILEGFRQSENTFSNFRVQQPKPNAPVQMQDSKIIHDLEPKFRTVYASNVKQAPAQPEPFPDYKRSEISYGGNGAYDFVQPNSHYNMRESPNFVKNSDMNYLKITTMPPSVYQPNYNPPTQPETDILKSINNQTFLDKHEGRLLQEIQQKMSLQIDKNTKTGEDIMNLRRVLEIEKQRLHHLDEQLKNEYKHIKINENETISNVQHLDDNLNETNQRSKSEDDKHNKMQSDLERIQVENDMLRGELKRLGEITSEKILDLENNINSVARMKEFENENFMMEKEKVSNSAEFVIEQMKVHFNERNSKIEEQMRKYQLEKDKLNMDLRVVTEELKMFNFNADQKINNTMNIIIQEEQEKHQAEVKEIEAKLRIEEEEIARITRRNQDLINKLQSVEREGKNRIMSKKNENTRLKEDLNNFEQAYNKLLIQVSNENREYEKKKEAIEILKEDHDDVQNKSHMLDQRYDEEMQNIQAGHEENLSELEREYSIQREKEQRLLQAIRDENDRIFDLQKRHAEIIDEIQKGFHSTFQTQFGKVQPGAK
jgi:hypothetical protein